MLSTVEKTRLRVSKSTEAKKKSLLGQFLTPAKIAQFMAGMFSPEAGSVCHLLDPGAGIGSLSSAFLERCISGELSFSKIKVTAFELDETLHKEIEKHLGYYANPLPLSHKIIGGDFVEKAVDSILFNHEYKISHAILNPPYRKISNDSRHRLLLRQAGIETVNLYSAFVALSLALMARGGQVVAIIPRSFCNGPYYRLFRYFILKRAAIRQIHLFKSRNTVFKDDDVLQENIIVMLERGGQQGDVKITTSTDDRFDDLASNMYPFERIVFPNDPACFIHVPTETEQNPIERSSKVRHSLEEIGIQVSTGPVVEYRMKEYLRNVPENGAAPLLYPRHFVGHNTYWPNTNTNKPNVIQRNPNTEKMLFPTGFYCVVRRFSSKEEKRRIVASVVRPDSFPHVKALGFENHLNVFHEEKHGLVEELAYGLAAFLNSTAVDNYFRSFNGHTQVNATDLRLIKYPSRDALMALGKSAMNNLCDQQTIDHLIEGLEIK